MTTGDDIVCYLATSKHFDFRKPYCRISFSRRPPRDLTGQKFFRRKASPSSLPALCLLNAFDILATNLRVAGRLFRREEDVEVRKVRYRPTGRRQRWHTYTIRTRTRFSTALYRCSFPEADEDKRGDERRPSIDRKRVVWHPRHRKRRLESFEFHERRYRRRLSRWRRQPFQQLR